LSFKLIYARYEGWTSLFPGRFEILLRVLVPELTV
jgi:hypothetical protein